MLIQVSEIPDQGLRIEGVAEFPQPFQDATWALDELSLVVEKDGDVVFVRGDLEARVPLHCGRCLEFYTVTVHPTVDARFVPAPQDVLLRGDVLIVLATDEAIALLKTGQA